MLGGKERSYTCKQTCIFYLQVCLSMYDLSLSHSMNGLIILLCFYCKDINENVGKVSIS